MLGFGGLPGVSRQSCASELSRLEPVTDTSVLLARSGEGRSEVASRFIPFSEGVSSRSASASAHRKRSKSVIAALSMKIADMSRDRPSSLSWLTSSL